MCSLVFVIVISLCVQYTPNVCGSPILEEAAGVSLPLPSGDPEPPIPLNGNGAGVVRLEDHSDASISPEIMVDATNPAEVGEDGSDLKTDASGYYGYGYSRYRPFFYNYYGNPYYNYRYYGNYYQPQTAQYPQYPQYYYPRNNYYYSNNYNPYRSQYRFEAGPYYY